MDSNQNKEMYPREEAKEVKQMDSNREIKKNSVCGRDENFVFSNSKSPKYVANALCIGFVSF